MGEDIERHQRADAARNRQRLLEAATAVFAESGLDAGTSEIVARAGVGRGTLFRNFPTKQDLIAAIVIERMRELIDEGRRLLTGGNPAEVPFEFVSLLITRQQRNRALIQAVDEEFFTQPEIHAAHAELVELLADLLAVGQAAGSVRREVGALDVLLLVKGVCATALAIDAGPDVVERQLDLVLSAISTPEHNVQLRGRTPTMADLEVAPVAVGAAGGGLTPRAGAA